MNHELTFSPTRPSRNSLGQFNKGHKPHNIGKNWSDYLSKRAQRKCAKGWKNLEKHRPKTRPDNAGRCNRRCVVITDDLKFKIFESLKDAALWVGGNRENVRRCCKENIAHTPLKRKKVNTDHKYKGYRFYFYNDPQWWDKLETI